MSSKTCNSLAVAGKVALLLRKAKGHLRQFIGSKEASYESDATGLVSEVNGCEYAIRTCNYATSKGASAEGNRIIWF